MGSANFSSTHWRGEIMAIVTVGIDLAKNVFAVHGVDETGQAIGPPSSSSSRALHI
jgi:hypothetical protein